MFRLLSIRLFKVDGIEGDEDPFDMRFFCKTPRIRIQHFEPGAVMKLGGVQETIDAFGEMPSVQTPRRGVSTPRWGACAAACETWGERAANMPGTN